MKQKDILLIAVVAIFAGVVSLFVSQAMFSSGGKRQLTAEKVDTIDQSFGKPDATVFNADAINPTKLITIGDGSNPKPF